MATWRSLITLITLIALIALIILVAHTASPSCLLCLIIKHIICIYVINKSLRYHTHTHTSHRHHTRVRKHITLHTSTPNHYLYSPNPQHCVWYARAHLTPRIYDSVLHTYQSHITHTGPRILTVFFYLSDVDEGGKTTFPKLDISITPKKGRALLWPSTLDSDPAALDHRTVHAAEPVLAGDR